MPAQYTTTVTSHRFYASSQTVMQQSAVQNAIGNEWMAYCNGLRTQCDNYYAPAVAVESFVESDPYSRTTTSDGNNNDDGSSMSSSTVTTTFGGKDYFEERVQIDRRKLEQMISATRDHHTHGRSENLTAEEFFSQVMTRTSTQITWPSRLKIGAKTKKDPYVKILGRPCDVHLAKDMVLSVLETRRSRVQLKIDVAYTDHSHIIGKQGKNTQQVMKDTGCHIHFPDSNRNPDLEKSNMVSIAGPLQAVEKARHAIRSLAPVVISFELKKYCGEAAELNEDPIITELSSKLALGILVRQNRASGTPFVIIRGSMNQEDSVKEAAIRLQRHYLRTAEAICSSSLEVLPAQQPTVFGVQNSNVRLIAEIAGATIHHPRSDVAGATTFFIQGTIESVLTARKHLIGCLPVSLVFEMQEVPNKINDISELERKMDLSISLRPKRNGETKQNIVVRGCERQISSIYAVRRYFIDKDEPIVVSTDYDFMKTFDPTAGLCSAVTTPLLQSSFMNSLVISSPSITSPMFNAAIPTVFAMSSQFPSLAAASQNYYGFNCATGNNDCSASHSRPSTTFSSFGSSRASPTESQTPNNLFACSADLSSSTNGSVTNDNTHNDPVPEEAPLASGLFEAARKIQETSQNDWKAPGAERLTKLDWAQEKLLANKAMQQKPIGDRTPNDHWSGCGFSRSMPAPMIRSRLLGENGQLKSSNLNEVEEEDEDKIGPWRVEPNVVTEPQQRKSTFGSTSYFDFVPYNNGISFTERDDVVTLLTKLELSKYVDVFCEQEIDMKTFLTMTDEDLKDIGVNAFGPRKKMLRAISEINERKKQFV